MNIMSETQFKLFKYDLFDYGWGCGWRTLQNCISKLYNIEISIEEIMNKLTDKNYSFNKNHYGFLDGSMIIDFFAYYPHLDVEKYDIYSDIDIENICIKMKKLTYNNFCGILIHDGYIVMIDNINNNLLKIIDPHQNPNIKEYIELNEIGCGGIGWVNIYDIIYKNIDKIDMMLDKQNYLLLNTPTIYLIKSN